MNLQLNDQEVRVLRSLSESSEGAVLLAYYKRMVDALTDTRNLQGSDVAVAVEAANRASAIIEENLIQPLSRFQQHKGEPERFD